MNLINNCIASILIPVYNQKIEYLELALDSVLSQKIDDFYTFEVIIVDDGCNHENSKIIENYGKKNSCIKIIKNPTNMGISISLNKALELAKAKYIIRMDSDDICKKDRFKKQIEFMEKNEDIGISGTAIEIIDECGNILGKNFYEQNSDIICCKILFDTTFAHPSVIIRKSILDQFKLIYNKDFKKAQDFELFSRLINYTKASNLKEILLQYRNCNCKLEFSKTFEYANKIRIRNLLSIGFSLDEINKNINGINCLYYRKIRINQHQFENLIEFCKKLIQLYSIEYNKNKSNISKIYIANFVTNCLLKIIYRDLIDRPCKNFLKNVYLVSKNTSLLNNFGIMIFLKNLILYIIIVTFKIILSKISKLNEKI